MPKVRKKAMPEKAARRFRVVDVIGFWPLLSYSPYPRLQFLGQGVDAVGLQGEVFGYIDRLHHQRFPLIFSFVRKV